MKFPPILNLIKIKSEELDIQFEFRTWVKTNLNQSAVKRQRLSCFYKIYKIGSKLEILFLIAS